MVSTAIQAAKAEARDQWERSAFVAFQTGAGKEKETFGKYLERVGLKEKSKPKGGDKEKALKIAQKISNAAKRGIK